MERIGSAVHKSPRSIELGGHFSLDKANASLVLVRLIVAEIVVEFRRLLDLQELVEAAEAAGDTTRAHHARQDLRDTFGRLERCRDELAELGIELRDWLRGIVHFPHVRNGCPGYLCWRHGEDHVAYWHPQDASFAQRQRIDGHGEGRYVSDNDS